MFKFFGGAVTLVAPLKLIKLFSAKVLYTNFKFFSNAMRVKTSLSVNWFQMVRFAYDVRIAKRNGERFKLNSAYKCAPVCVKSSGLHFAILTLVTKIWPNDRLG